MEQIPAGGTMTIVTGLAVGLLLGFILQRGRFCMNSAFRDVVFIQDMTLFRAYLLALVVAMVGSNLMEDLHLLISVNFQTGQHVVEELRRQPFLPIANIVGGYLFGLGIVLAGGCGSGILFKIGEGTLAAFMAVLGFFLGISATMHGWLHPVYEWIAGLWTPEIASKDNPALWELFGSGLKVKWITIAVVCIPMLTIIAKGKPLGKAAKGYYWSKTGLLAGLTVVLAWWVSSYFGATPRGLSFTGPTKEFFFSFITGSSNANDPEFNFYGIFKSTWSALYVIGVPIGAFLSARGLKEFKWKVPPAEELVTVFLGSLLMGFGATVGGGCNVGHGLTGASTLAISSIVTTIFILLGNWTMVYFRFIKPMKD
jgi:uncharacterized membrane protein YedE/YeeE